MTQIPTPDHVAPDAEAETETDRTSRFPMLACLSRARRYKLTAAAAKAHRDLMANFEEYISLDRDAADINDQRAAVLSRRAEIEDEYLAVPARLRTETEQAAERLWYMDSADALAEASRIEAEASQALAEWRGPDGTVDSPGLQYAVGQLLSPVARDLSDDSELRTRETFSYKGLSVPAIVPGSDPPTLVYTLGADLPLDDVKAQALALDEYVPFLDSLLELDEQVAYTREYESLQECNEAYRKLDRDLEAIEDQRRELDEQVAYIENHRAHLRKVAFDAQTRNSRDVGRARSLYNQRAAQLAGMSKADAFAEVARIWRERLAGMSKEEACAEVSRLRLGQLSDQFAPK